MDKIQTITQIEHLQNQIAKNERKWHRQNSIIMVIGAVNLMGYLILLANAFFDSGNRLLMIGLWVMLIFTSINAYLSHTLGKLEKEIDAQRQQASQLRIQLATEEHNNPTTQ